jgi:hypothetical protein
MTDWHKVSIVLNKAADLMETTPGLDPDGAVRKAVWGSRNAPYPGDNAPGAEEFDEAESLIECYIADEDGDDPGNGIAWIPAPRAITAARAEADRVRAYS